MFLRVEAGRQLAVGGHEECWESFGSAIVPHRRLITVMEQLEALIDPILNMFIIQRQKPTDVIRLIQDLLISGSPGHRHVTGAPLKAFMNQIYTTAGKPNEKKTLHTFMIISSPTHYFPLSYHILNAYIGCNSSGSLTTNWERDKH